MATLFVIGTAAVAFMSGFLLGIWTAESGPR
jgi:hypothetical protein